MPSSLPKISIVFILVDRILKTFDNSEHQNLDEFTDAQFSKPRSKFISDTIVDIVDLMTGGRDIHGYEKSVVHWSDHMLRYVNKVIDKAINSAFRRQKPLIEWILGYEVTEANLPSARTEIYWIVKDAARDARSKSVYLQQVKSRRLAWPGTGSFPIVFRGHTFF